MEKKINYIARNFNDIKNELINFSQDYYPEISTNFNDKSVGNWFIDLCASVGDNLHYAIDRNYQESQVNTSSSLSSACNNARANGLKVPGRKASICEVEFSCELPVNGSLPNWDLAPIIKKGAIISCGQYSYETLEDVNFKEQFNYNGFSNRKYVAMKNSNGSITHYLVSKTTLARSGTTKVYKKIISNNDLKPFMEVVLPDKDVMEVESIIFKETSSFQASPKMQEYFIPKEQFKANGESIYTYRFFEVDSLAEQYKFMEDIEQADNGDKGGKISYIYNETDTTTEEKDKRQYHIYKGKWNTIRQKYITEYTNNGYTKIIFGASNDNREVPEGQQNYSDYVMSNTLNNDMLGILPKSNWTMFVLYRVGGGQETNIAEGALTTISFIDVVKPTNGEIKNINHEMFDTKDVNKVIASIKVKNTSVALGGKNSPSVQEIKYLTKYNNNAQRRCVTLKDYKSCLLQMPPKYGCPFRLNCIEENNKIGVSLLYIDDKGKLSDVVPTELVNNMKSYISHYKSTSDYVEFKKGKIFNLQFIFDLFISKNYDVDAVAKKVINTIKDYMDINKHDMGDEVFIGDIQKEITSIDGVISIIDTTVTNIYGHGYSNDKAPFPSLDTNEDLKPQGENAKQDSQSYRIDFNKMDGVLANDYDSMFEIKNPDNDIKLRIKVK